LVGRPTFGESGLARTSRFCRMKNLVRMSNSDESLQKKPVRNLRANITVFSGTVSFQKVLALPAIIFDLDR
jgi:hypothetical protein